MNSDVIVEGESPEVNLRRWSIRPLDAKEKGNPLKRIAVGWSVATGDSL